MSMNAVTQDRIVEFPPTATRPLALQVRRSPDGYMWAGLAIAQPWRLIATVGTELPYVDLHIVRGEWRLSIGETDIDITQAEAQRLRDELQLPVRSES